MISKIIKLNIIGENKYLNEVMEKLHSLGNVEIEKAETDQIKIFNNEEEISKLDYKIAQVNFAVKYLEEQKNILKYEETETQSWQEKLIKPKIKITNKELQNLLKTYDWEKKVVECEKAEEKINNSINKIKMIKEKLGGLKKWEEFRFTANDFKETITSKSILVEINENVFEKINEILKPFEFTAWEKISDGGKRICLLVVYLKKEEKRFLEYLGKNNVSIIEAPEFKNSPKTEIMDSKLEIRAEEEIIQKVKKRINSLIGEQNKLKIISDWLVWQKDKFENSLKAIRTKHVFYVSIWTAKDRFDKIKEHISRISPKILLTEAKIEDNNSKIPVILKNKNWAEPFELVTGMYGSPLYNEPDPTPYLAPFFTLFFALAITDAMYGLVLAFLGILAIKLFKLPKENQKLFKIIVYGGLATFFIGALFGGWFGLVLEDLPKWLGGPLIKLRLINPMTDTIKFLLITFILGIIQIIAGLTVSMYWKIRHGEVLAGIMDNGFWILLLGSLGLWAGTANSGIGHYFKFSAIISACLLVLTQGRDANNIFMKALKGILSLYNITTYFSDMLSYSRLLALGLATGIIALVINIIAGIAINMIPFFGWIIAIIILIVGHLFNIGINVLGAYIHSSRLQYVEYFPKFMEGGGKTFQPFRRESKYINISD